MIVARAIIVNDSQKTKLYFSIYREKVLFENKNDEVYTANVNEHKIGLNRDNDKRGNEADGVAMLAKVHPA